MAALPFGNNPFSRAGATPTAPTENQPRPTASKLGNFAPPPPPHAAEKSKKRDGAETTKNPQKKPKTAATEDTPIDSVASLFGSIASDNYSDQDAQNWLAKKVEDGEENFKMGLGDVFVHGLSLLAQKNNKIKEQDRALKKLKGEASVFNSRLSEAQKKAADESKARKDEVGKLQAALEKMSSEAKSMGEALEGENAALKKELDGVKARRDKELSDAYSMGFLGYLQNFLAADPDYDWSAHFAPSTSDYMLKFKADNAKAIIEAKGELQQKIKAELAAAEAKKTIVGEDNQESRAPVSPSETAGS